MHQKIILRVLLLNIICFVISKCETYPCKYSQEACIRKYLSQKSTCEPIENGPNLDPSYLDSIPFEVPSFNISECKYDSRFVGLRHSYPLELKVDEAANYTILKVFHPAVTMEGLIEVAFYSEGNAPVVRSTTYVENFSNFTTTTMIPGVESLDLDAARTFTALSVVPTIVLGDNVAEERAKNPLIDRILAAVLSDFKTIVAEEGVTLYPQLIRSYIGQNLCTYNGN